MEQIKRNFAAYRTCYVNDDVIGVADFNRHCLYERLRDTGLSHNQCVQWFGDNGITQLPTISWATGII